MWHSQKRMKCPSIHCSTKSQIQVPEVGSSKELWHKSPVGIYVKFHYHLTFNDLPTQWTMLNSRYYENINLEYEHSDFSLAAHSSQKTQLESNTSSLSLGNLAESTLPSAEVSPPPSQILTCPEGQQTHQMSWATLQLSLRHLSKMQQARLLYVLIFFPCCVAQNAFCILTRAHETGIDLGCPPLYVSLGTTTRDRPPESREILMFVCLQKDAVMPQSSSVLIVLVNDASR